MELGIETDRRLFGYGIAWLALGLFVYLVARPRTIVPFFPQALNLAALVPSQVRSLLGSVPTFLHVLAFSLMSGALVGRTHTRRLFVCGAWAGIEIVFELGQYPAVRQWLLQQWDPMPSIPYVHDYLIGGTFDYADVFAAIFGAALAGLFVTQTKRRLQ